jgi:hypothetical protein
MRVQLSDQSIEALANIISGGSANDGDPPIGVYRQGWKIEAWFKAFGVPVKIGSQSRLPATRTALNLAIFLDSSDLVKRIVERAADPRDFISKPEKHLAVVAYLNKHLVFDGVRLESSGLSVELIEVSQSSGVVEALAAVAGGIDFDTVQRDLDRAVRAADADPEIAVTAACSVVESVCWSILVELDVEVPVKQDISGLYRAIRDPLGLSPTKEGLSSDIVNDVKAVLSGLVTTVQNIGSLRTHAGSAHGKGRGFRRIDARIARLAVHSASAIALFLIETWKLRYPDRILPLKAKK